MATMTSIERVETVLAGGIPDRVPVDLHDFMVAARASGTSLAEHFHSAEAMAEAHIASWRRYRHDVVLVESGTASLAEACGVGAEYLADSAPVSLAPAIASLDEVDRLVVPDPYRVSPLRENLEATRLVVREIGREAFIMGRADQGPFSLASMILGMEGFLLALALPDQAEGLARLLAFCETVVQRYAVAQAEQGAHMTSIGDSVAGPDVCSPAVYRALAWPAEERLARHLAGHGIRLACHICGNATPIVPDMVATSAAVLELDWKCELPAVKAAAAGRATVLGVIDPSGVIARGTPETVEAAARDELAVLAPGGGLILGPGCALPPDTPAENIEALVAAAERWGRYRPNGSLLTA
jgi:uroporphyrinogen decarboxylase